VSGWIKDTGRGGALEFVRLGLVEVRLYLDPDGRLIGFGALGPATWTLADGTALRVWLLNFLGIHSNFRHQPSGTPREASYGRRILRGLIQEVERRGDAPLFALYVDPDNKARQLYQEFGWTELDIWSDPLGDGRAWVRMLRPIPLSSSGGP
jgi:GNAT superfamily N-acetyltransferase